MKRAYVRPTMVGERFVANEYVAACGITYDASTADKFLDGYYVRGLKVTPVKVWRGEKGDNTHCTTKINIKEWETAKS